MDYSPKTFYDSVTEPNLGDCEMDVTKTLRELYVEKKRLDRAIARLEAQRGAASRNAKTRGRNTMGPQERLEVSRRMTAYWAARRAQADGSHDRREPEPGASSATA